MPAWAALALVPPLIIGLVNIIDKLIVDRHVREAFTYPFYVGVVEIIVAPIVFATIAISGLESLEPKVVLMGLAVGAFRGLTLIMLVAALRQGQVARVVSMWFLSPLMVAIIAAIFLDEALTAVAWIAVIMAVGGAVIVSWNGVNAPQAFIPRTMFVYTLVAALAWALSNVISKGFIRPEVFWQLYWASRIGSPLILLTLGAFPKVRNEAASAWRSRTFIVLLLVAETLVSVGIIIYFAAINLGPVSLVSAIGAIQPLAVFVYSLVLVNLSQGQFGTWVTRGTVRSQLVGIAVITAGVALISLQ